MFNHEIKTVHFTCPATLLTGILHVQKRMHLRDEHVTTSVSRHISYFHF